GQADRRACVPGLRAGGPRGTDRSRVDHGPIFPGSVHAGNRRSLSRFGGSRGNATRCRRCAVAADLRSMALPALTAAVRPALLFPAGARALRLRGPGCGASALLFGGPAPAAAMVLSTYFAGLALGARRGGRIRPRGLPLRSYAGLVGGVAALAVCYVL